jgi:hypothetical protein
MLSGWGKKAKSLYAPTKPTMPGLYLNYVIFNTGNLKLFYTYMQNRTISFLPNFFLGELKDETYGILFDFGFGRVK